MWGTDAPVLSSIKPGAAGVYLTGPETAASLLRTLRDVPAEDLAILVLGHGCPDPDSCSGPVTFPVTCRSNGSSVLVAGCLHNVGALPIRAHLPANATVELPPVKLCQFEVYAHELEEEAWAKIVASPVKAVQDMFVEAGVARPFVEPWARRFYRDGRPSQPDLATRVAFMGKVAAEHIDRLLTVSGHNSVYITPEGGGPLACPLSGQGRIAMQRGLVYTRQRYGVRVPATSSDQFERIFAKVRPGTPVPSRIQISQVYRLGPTPQSAGPLQVQQWED